MSDSEEEGEGANLTGFLFGNINPITLKLDDDDQFLTDSERKSLSALRKFGLGGDDIFRSQREEKIQGKIHNHELYISDSDSSAEGSDEEEYSSKSNKIVAEDDYDGSQKEDSAVDFFDIQEVADEDVAMMGRDETDYDSFDTDCASVLMPPPAIPRPRELSHSDSISKYIKEEEERRQLALETPLAAMLPSKYAGTDVRVLFPDFSPDRLRFLRLFGWKPTFFPNVWKVVRKRRKKKGDDDEDIARRKRLERGWDWNYSHPQGIISIDDECRLMERSEGGGRIGNGAPHGFDGRNGSGFTNLWRRGPAELWYDMLNVPEEVDSFDYGFKSTPDPEESDDEPIATEAFQMVSQVGWEGEVILDGTEKSKKSVGKGKAAGWVPSSTNRTAQNFPSKPTQPNPAAPPPSTPTKAKAGVKEETEDTWFSIFPIETDDLVKDNWENEVIWDADGMGPTPVPKILTLDPNDDDIILCIPDDIDPNATQGNSAPVKVKIPHPHVKKSKILLGKAGVINVIEEDSPPPSPKNDDKDPYNISNDEFYSAKATESSLIKISAAGNIIQHSTPVVELRAPFIPTHMGPMRLRNFHRPHLKKFSMGNTASYGPHPLFPLSKHINKKAKQREAERLAAGGGDIFFMRTPEDLSGKDGEILLVEFCEEHPPLLNQVGMCSKLKNYYKRKAGKDTGPKCVGYGETTYAHSSPFLGAMHPGQTIATLENNLFRAPIYEHPKPNDIFLVIRTRSNFFIRSFESLFTAGQLCPLYEVPGPNSKRANNFVRDFLQVFIYRLFWKSKDNPRRIRMDDIKRAFPLHSESSIRKRLKLCADFKRTGVDSNWWVIKPEFRLPTEEEIRAMVSPEQCCGYYSLTSAEQRLKDAGYGEKFLFAPAEDDEEDKEVKIEDEVKTAPWNTTRAYIQAMKGKCLLQLTGIADPTGCGEGFSYIRVPNKPQTSKEEQEAQPKRIVTGTDADLRRLSLNNAKALLRKFGVPEDEIKKLSRWEVIDVVRTLSTEKAKAGEKGMTKFSRGNRFSVAEHQERYKEECQRIFELQNRVLASSEVLSTDEGESSEEELSDIEEMGKNIENMLSNKKTSSQLVDEKEEEERRELQKMIMGEGKEKEEKGAKGKRQEDHKTLCGLENHPGRVLMIHRKFKSSEGKEFTRTEIVRKPSIIDIYMRIRTTKDENFIRQFALLDDSLKEEMKKEKRRIQEQLRRIKRNQEKEGHRTPKKTKKVKSKPDLKMKCGACGQVGHMRTNKACPLYQSANSPVPPLPVAMTEEQEEEAERAMITDDEELVKVDGTKVQLSGKLFKQADEIKRRSLLLKVPKDAMGGKRRAKRPFPAPFDSDYLVKKGKVNRARVDPYVVLEGILDSVVSELKKLPDVAHFLFPVNPRLVPNYHNLIQRPMDLQTIRDKVRDKKYSTRNDFLADVLLIVENSAIFNGPKHFLTDVAGRMLEVAKSRLEEDNEKVEKLEKMINPMLDGDQQALAHILRSILNHLKTMPEAYPFLKPVSKKKVNDYYDVIHSPIDFELITKKVDTGKYTGRNDFMADIHLLHLNAKTYNSENSIFTEKAEKIVLLAEEMIAQFEEDLRILELNLGSREADSEEMYEESQEDEIMDSTFDDESQAAIEAMIQLSKGY